VLASLGLSDRQRVLGGLIRKHLSSTAVTFLGLQPKSAAQSAQEYLDSIKAEAPGPTVFVRAVTETISHEL